MGISACSSNSTMGPMNLDPGQVPDVGLPALPQLTNVTATEREDSVGIDFDPVDGAKDYRVYVLPDAKDLKVNSDGSLAIKNAVYHCAGLRQTFDFPNGVDNPIPTGQDNGVLAYFNAPFSGRAEVAADPTLGYVYVEAGDGRVPVYAVGVHPADTELGWRETRPKIYTTDAKLRQSLISANNRDDGIVFYVPTVAAATTRTVFHSEQANGVNTNVYYFTATDTTHTNDSTKPEGVFEVLTAAAPGTQPLMGVFYKPPGNHFNQWHTELAVGRERYQRALNQGPGPLWHLEWPGLTAQSTLVVEALENGCPFQGYLSPISLSAPPHQTLFTLDDLQHASATGEVYVNGQFDLPNSSFTTVDADGSGGPHGGVWGMLPSTLPLMQTPNASPRPIARAFLKVSPKPHDPGAWDWYAGFNAPLPTMTPDVDGLCSTKPTGMVPVVTGGGGCGYWTSSLFNVGAYAIDTANGVPLFAVGVSEGQLMTVIDDQVQDVGGLLRMQVPTMTTVSADSFLHITWSVDIMGTHRRYPQMILSDYPSSPSLLTSMFDTNNNGNVVIVQTFGSGGPNPRYEMQAFHGLVSNYLTPPPGHPWNVNNQVPAHAFIEDNFWNGGDAAAVKDPTIPIFEYAGMDRLTKFDVYVSSERVYAFVEDTPAGCTFFPPASDAKDFYYAQGFALKGPVSVSFGDVIYHESASDEGVCGKTQMHPYPFMHEHQCSETKRRWDNLGFKAGVAAPAWDEARFPCKAYGANGTFEH